jgi:hypothetical protein
MQLCTLLPTPKLIQLDYLVASEALITLVAHTCQAEAACPGCGRASNLVQSRYTRTLADLPWHGIPVRLQLRLRRFFCDQRDCATAIFTERLPALVKHYSRRTCRQAHTLDQIGYALGGEAGARLATSLGISISADTLLRRLHGRRPRRGPAPRVLGVDDWAFRKGHHYGTILVDLEKGCPIDLLPDRQGETLGTWLKEHPGVEIVVRDCGGAYAEGAQAGVDGSALVTLALDHDCLRLWIDITHGQGAMLAHSEARVQKQEHERQVAVRLTTPLCGIYQGLRLLRCEGLDLIFGDARGTHPAARRLAEETLPDGAIVESAQRPIKGVYRRGAHRPGGIGMIAAPTAMGGLGAEVGEEKTDGIGTDWHPTA